MEGHKVGGTCGGTKLSASNFINCTSVEMRYLVLKLAIRCVLSTWVPRLGLKSPRPIIGPWPISSKGSCHWKDEGKIGRKREMEKSRRTKRTY